jgi:copper chaperone CopZ
MEEIRLPDMHCQGCAGRVKAALALFEPGIWIEFNLADKTVEVQSSRTKPELVDVFHSAGFKEAA